jgi:hypothetical protein
MGRPSVYTAELASVICERLVDGESLRAICQNGGMPDDRTVRRWAVHDVQGFASRYFLARQLQADCLADEILEIADDASRDWLPSRMAGEAEEVVPNHEHINRSKLRVDARKWLMSRLAPKKYGDKITHSGDPESPMTLVPAINVTIGSAGPVSSSVRGQTRLRKFLEPLARQHIGSK